MPRFRRRNLLGLLALILLALLYYGVETHHIFQNHTRAAGNSTLGFQKIIALSQGSQWRIDGLYAAANWTGLDIEIPKRPDQTPDMIAAYESMADIDGKSPTHGAAMAWVAHMSILEYVILKELDTVLIIEDDVDWDVDLKRQMKRTANGIRLFTDVPRHEQAPYGRNWDVLWIGHCGEYMNPFVVYEAWRDPSVIPRDEYSGWAAQYLHLLPEGMRATQHSWFPVCSFAYAVSREGAKKIFQYASHGGGEAFDVKLATGCRELALNCLTVHPEVMHEFIPLADGLASEVKVADGIGHAITSEVIEKGSTKNIRRSTRCKVLFGGTCLAIHRPHEVAASFAEQALHAPSDSENVEDV